MNELSLRFTVFIRIEIANKNAICKNFCQIGNTSYEKHVSLYSQKNLAG